jgi:alpha-L-fucosidase
MFIYCGVDAVPTDERQGKPIGSIGNESLKKAKFLCFVKRAVLRISPAKCDPAAWAKLAKQAGMKYVLMTSKHHDCFALYDSKVNDCDVMNFGAKRDLLEPLAKTVRAEGSSSDFTTLMLGLGRIPVARYTAT